MENTGWGKAGDQDSVLEIFHGPAPFSFA